MRVERQAIAHRRVARDQVAALARAGTTGRSASASPARRRARAAARSRPTASRPCSKTCAQARRARAVVELRVERIDVDRQPALAPQVVEGVFVSRRTRARATAQPLGDAARGTRCASSRRDAAVVASRRRAAPGSCQIGSPSRRQKQLSDQRGSCSPGYHLPWPKCDRPLRRVLLLAAGRYSSTASRRLVGPERRRCSTRRRRGRRPTRRSARRPW